MKMTKTRRKLIQLLALGKAIGHLEAKERIGMFFNASDLESLAWDIINSMDNEKNIKEKGV